MDKFGCYRAGGIKTPSKFVALQTGQTSFEFNDSVFAAIDTTIEPAETLDQLYIRRAEQIRSKYDYVVLMYSGGSDSNNVLDSFLKAGLKIDELCTTWDYPTTGELNSFHNEETTKVVIPRVRELPIKHRLVDITPLTIGAFDKLGMDFEYYLNHFLSPNNIAKHFLREHVREWVDMIAKGKRLCLVWGLEKPVITVYNDKWYLSFIDMIDNCVGHYTNRPGWFDELFYYTPDMPELPIKQAHVIKRFCTNDLSPQMWMYRDKPSSYGYNKAIGKYVTVEGVNSILYPTWNRETFCNGKGWSLIYSERDKFFLSGNVKVDRYKQIVDSMYFRLKDDTPVNERYSFYPMYSKKYAI